MGRKRIVLSPGYLDIVVAAAAKGGTAVSILADLRSAGFEEASRATVGMWLGQIRGVARRSPPAVAERMRAKAAERAARPPTCSICHVLIGGAGATGMCPRCVVISRHPPLPPRKCGTCSAETANLRQAYCSAACRPLRVKRKDDRRRGNGSYTRRDKHAVLAALVSAQGGVCAGCRTDGGTRGLLLDHDHTTGAPRAALCHGCNTSFGLLGESPEKIRGLLEFALSLRSKAVA